MDTYLKPLFAKPPFRLSPFRLSRQIRSLFVLIVEIPCKWTLATQFASNCGCDSLVHSAMKLPMREIQSPLSWGERNGEVCNICVARASAHAHHAIDHSVLQGAAPRGAQFYFVFAVLRTLSSCSKMSLFYLRLSRPREASLESAVLLWGFWPNFWGKGFLPNFCLIFFSGYCFRGCQCVMLCGCKPIAKACAGQTSS